MTRIEARLAFERTLAASALAILAIGGCGGPADSFTRFPAEGSVMLDGQPLKAGTITFIAQQEGASSSAEIADGAFRLDDDDGLSPGPYRVEVYSIQPTGRKVPTADDPNTMIDETTNLVPRRYNVQSTLTTNVPPEGPEGPLSFSLETAPPKRAKR